MEIEQGVLTGMRPSEMARRELEALVGHDSLVLVQLDYDISNNTSKLDDGFAKELLVGIVTRQYTARVKQIRNDSQTATIPH